MFWDKILELCNNSGISPSKLCETLNFSNATATKWKNGATPHDSSLKKIAEFFNVSIDYLVGKQEVNETRFTYAAYDELTHDLSPEQIEQLKTYAEFLRIQK